VLRDIEHGMELTARNTGMALVVALNYGARGELVDAFNRILDRVRRNGIDTFKVDEQTVADNLYTAGLPDPDLLIRTSGEMRVSNFLLWQIAYAEIYVTETLWPDFNRARLLEAFLDFQKRERRFGGLTAMPAPAETMEPAPRQESARAAARVETDARMALASTGRRTHGRG
jgi:undecaprenyl diphosphate synthase